MSAVLQAGGVAALFIWWCASGSVVAFALTLLAATYFYLRRWRSE